MSRFMAGDRVILANHDARGMGAPIGSLGTVKRGTYHWGASGNLYIDVEWEGLEPGTQGNGNYQASMFKPAPATSAAIASLLEEAGDYYAAVTEAAE